VKAPAAELVSDGLLGDGDPMASGEDPGDLGSRATREPWFRPSSNSLSEPVGPDCDQY